MEALENVKSTIDGKLSGAKLKLLGDSVPIEDNDEVGFFSSLFEVLLFLM